MLICFRQFFFKVSCTCSSNYSVYDGECTYTHLLHAHFSAHSALTAYFAHLHACHIHACLKCHEKGVHRMSVISLHLAFSLLMSHPPWLFPHGHFETTPDNDFTDDPVHVFLPNFPVLKAQDIRNSAPASRSLANESKKFDKNTSVDDETTLINDPNHNISNFSKTTKENIGQFGVPTVFETSASHVSHDDFALQMESKESMQSGNRC